MSTLKQNISTVKKRYKDRTGVDAIIHVSKGTNIRYEMFPLWCSSPTCESHAEQTKLLNFLITILDLYLEQDENAFQFIDAVLPHLPELEEPRDGISWIQGYLSGVSGADISKLKLSLFEEDGDYDYEE